MELLIHRHARDSYRQPRLGLELNRHMHAAGPVEREVVSLMLCGVRYDAVTQYGWNPTAA
jgi:hypothetical protein